MPLSDHEQRLLEQMERALYAEDPKFVSSLRGTDLRSHYRRRALASAVGFLLGVALLMTGVVSTIWIVGILGFVLMLASALFAVTSWRKVSGSAEPVRSNVTPLKGRSKGRPKGPKRGMTERFEDRWRRRREEGR
ncbi:spore wall synthesis complex protein [Sporichthya brevicatena]|uniref:Spore wall synthesis complex protein n=1 Tax=Sporichthya brevicatena TaxID=171442 RepID=A0ABN1GT45_9ACTN